MHACLLASRCARVCARACSMCTRARLFICFLLYLCFTFTQITNSNELPLAIIAHFSADPTRWAGSECATLCLCAHQNRERRLSKCAKKKRKKKKQETGCSLLPKWFIICTKLSFVCHNSVLCILILPKRKCWSSGGKHTVSLCCWPLQDDHVFLILAGYAGWWNSIWLWRGQESV